MSGVRVAAITSYRSLVRYFLAVGLVAAGLCERGGMERCGGKTWSILVDFFTERFVRT